jgi:hypothetical protein
MKTGRHQLLIDCDMHQALNPRHKRIFAVKDGTPSSAQVPIRVPPNVSYFGKSDADDREIQSRLLAQLKIDHSSAASNGSSGTESIKDDMSMVTAMAARLRVAESQVKALREDCKVKDRLIYDLQKRLTELSSTSNPQERPKTAPSKELPLRGNGDLVMIKESNARLRLQLEEMHQFLADYGLKWVGDDNKISDAECQKVKQPSQGPEALGFELDMQRILAHAKELNGITGQKRLAKHGPIRQFENLPEVCITFYADGLLVRNGPARAYAMKESRLLVRDLIDGYFPFEFKADFPDGVKLVVLDKLSESCVQVRKSPFEGVGHSLDSGRNIQQNAKQDPDTADDLAGLRALRARHGGVAPQHLQHFVQKLPHSVIVGGEVVNVRSGITELSRKPKVASIFTEQESVLLKDRTIEDAVEHLVQAAEVIIASPISQKLSPKNVNGFYTHHSLVVRQPAGDSLPKMQLPSDTVIGKL